MILFYDFEVFKYDWLVCIGDVEHKQMHTIVNSQEELQKFYDDHKEHIWVGYNSRHYDSVILKSILVGLDPYEVSQQLIVEGKKGFEISSLLNNVRLYNYDTKHTQHSLKKLEGFMGSSIVETSVSFDIDRKLTNEEIQEVIKYCKHDVRETFKVFTETITNFNSHIKLMREFNMPLSAVSKTGVGLTAQILKAKRQEHNDEFDLVFCDTMKLGKYEYIKTIFEDWVKLAKEEYENGIDKSEIYKKLEFETNIAGVPHKFAAGGLHGAILNFIGEGRFIMVDVGSYYPTINIEYKLLSRNVTVPQYYNEITQNRLKLKKIEPARANVLKVPLNGAYGACKDKYSPMFDPRNATSVCVNGQLFLVDLAKDLETCSKIIQSNTDGILIQVFTDEEEQKVKELCDKWCERTKFTLDYDYFTHIYQRDVNNYIAWNKDGTGKITKLKRKGSYKKRTAIDNQLSIVNDAILNYVMYNTPVEKTINECDELIKFQQVMSIGKTYEWLAHNGKRLNEKCVRVFASKNQNDTSIFKKHVEQRNPYKIEKLAGVPNHCFIDNSDITNKKVPTYLDKSWYVDYTNYQLALLFGTRINGLTDKQYVNKLKVDYTKGLGSSNKGSKNYNPNLDRDVMIAMLGNVV